MYRNSKFKKSDILSNNRKLRYNNNLKSYTIIKNVQLLESQICSLKYILKFKINLFKVKQGEPPYNLK